MNLHEITLTSPSSWRVCQFRHLGSSIYDFLMTIWPRSGGDNDIIHNWWRIVNFHFRYGRKNYVDTLRTAGLALKNVHKIFL